MPKVISFGLFLNRLNVRVYYSLYSLDENFRKRWLPKAADPWHVLPVLAGLHVKIHHPLILNENDSEAQATQICEMLQYAKTRHNTSFEFNLIRYNPFSHAQGQETTPERSEKYLKVLQDSEVFDKIKTVPRVGTDVHASCGMFMKIPIQLQQSHLL